MIGHREKIYDIVSWIDLKTILYSKYHIPYVRKELTDTSVGDTIYHSINEKRRSYNIINT